ncbi:MAG: hypothetical protein PVI21_00840 [Candidatus Woesebacteria bacterium]|jgi:hypothetical protein
MTCIFAVGAVFVVALMLAHWTPAVRAMDTYWNNWLVGHLANGVNLGKLSRENIETRVRRDMRSGVIDKTYQERASETQADRDKREADHSKAIENQVATLVHRVMQKLDNKA